MLNDWLKGGEHSSYNLHGVANWILAHRTIEPILDCGCGNGDLLRYLRVSGIPSQALYGCDIEPGHVGLSAVRNGKSGTFRVWDMEDGNPFPELRFGFVCAISWLHNDWKTRQRGLCKPRGDADWTPELALDGLISCLAPGGRLIYDWRNDAGGPEFQHSVESRGLVLEHQFTMGYPHPTLIYRQKIN
jgi:SAM-dependent methyltransferase